MKHLLIQLLTKLVNLQRATPYRYERDIQGHEVWVIRAERHHDSTALYVVLDRGNSELDGVIIEPHDPNQPIQVDIAGLQNLEFTSH